MDLLTYQQRAIITNKWLTIDPKKKEILEQKKAAQLWVTVREAPSIYCPRDVDHMCIGMASELDELYDAVKQTDRIAIKEELGDIMWYAVNLASMRSIHIQAQLDVGSYTWDQLVYSVSKLINVEKRLFIYFSADDQYLEQEKAHLQKVIECCYNFYFSPNYGKLPMNEVFELNIRKLQKVRYKLGYTDEAALNRNLEAERKELES